MNFDLSEEQTLLKDSIQKFIADNYELSVRRKQSKQKPGYSEEHWKTFADLGWLGLPFPEQYGGFGGNLIDTMVVMEELGKGLALEPYFATVILAGNALLLGGTEAQKEKLIPEIIAGDTKATFAYAEEQARYNLEDVGTSAEKSGDSYVINGTKSVVWNASTADYVIVAARTSGKRTDRDGITCFLVKADAEGIKMTNYPTVCGHRASEIAFTDVKVNAEDMVGEEGKGIDIVEEVADRAILALSAEAVGAMECLYKDTVTYTSQREQFGHPLSDFQTVKHKLAEMFVETEQTRSMLYRATIEKEAQEEKDARLDIHALKHMVGKYGRFIGQGAVQLHGGMGQTEELAIGHYFIRLQVIDTQFGDHDFHLQQFANKMDVPTEGDDEMMLPF